MATKVDVLAALDRIAPQMEAVPDGDDSRCCEWVLFQERERTRRHLLALFSAVDAVAERLEGFACVLRDDGSFPVTQSTKDARGESARKYEWVAGEIRAAIVGAQGEGA